MLVGFALFSQVFHLGASAFFDTGRVWSDYTFRSSLDGNSLGLKYGVGVGAYLLWGVAAIFRADLAYSPDTPPNSLWGAPLALYVSDGVMF